MTGVRSQQRADPGDPVDPVVLVARSGLLAGAVVVLGSVGHLSLTGRTPAPAAIAVLLAGVFVLALALLRTPAGPGRIVALLVGGQGAVHLALGVASGHAGPGGLAVAAPGTLALPVEGGRRLGSLQDSHDVATGHVDLAALVPGHLASDLPTHAPLLALHLCAAVLVGLALALLEHCLWTLVALLTAAVLCLLAPLAPLPRGRARVRATRARGPRPLLFLAPTVVRRGPPAVLGAA